MQQPALAQARAAALPLFYVRPRVVTPQSHGGLSLRPEPSYGFARAANAIPLTLAEMAAAMRDYPIVFTDEALPMPVAVVGLREGRNLMVEPDGRWRAGAYVPAYLRRYPFLFAENPETQALTLCVDEASERLEPGERNPLFRGGEPGEATRQALEFCKSYQRDHQATRELCRRLAQVELLTLRDARLQLPDRPPVVVRGFRMIDEAKLNLLPAETFLDWRGKGWITPIYAHLLSLGSWERLGYISRERDAE